MQETKTRRAMAGRLMAFSLFTFFAVSPTFGQIKQVVKMPFEFTIASKVLPAGTYTFSIPSGSLGRDNSLRVQSDTGTEMRAPILTRLGGPSGFLQDGSLVFDKTGGGHVLCEVWIPGTDGLLLHSTPKGHGHEILLLSDLNPNPGLTGSAAYERTCRRCHGPDGKGEERADKFFKIAIPRLSSAKVQSKSDEELREIITKGTRAMPTVEIDESGFRHGLARESVDSVIAYVRTLKQ